MKKKELYEAPSVETYELALGSRPLMGSKDGINDIKGNDVVDNSSDWSVVGS